MSPGAAKSLGNLASGLGSIALALACWALTWVLGARQVVGDILHREAGGITGLEMAAFAVWSFGLIYFLALAWRLGNKKRG